MMKSLAIFRELAEAPRHPRRPRIPKVPEAERYCRSTIDINLSPLTRRIILVLIAGCVFVISVMVARICQSLKDEPMALGLEKGMSRRFRSRHRSPSIVWFALSNTQSKQTNIECILDAYESIFCDVFDKTQAPSLADAYLFEADSVKSFPLKRNPKTIWGILQHGSPVNQSLMLHEEYLRLFNFSSTFSRESNVPTSLYWLSGLKHITSTCFYINTTAKNDLCKNGSCVMFIATDCKAIADKLAYVEALMDYIPIDSFGDCLHNKDLPSSMNLDDFTEHLYDDSMLRFLARYKFVIAIEDAICNDYMTEKLWRSIEVGVVPIYYGSPLIRDWLPNNKSAILLEDFPTPELLSQHLHYLLNNDTAYEEYLEHKTLGNISNEKLIRELEKRSYQNNLFQIKRKFECYVCEKIYENEIDLHINTVTKNHYNCQMTPPNVTFNVNDIDRNKFYHATVKVESNKDTSHDLKSFNNSNNVKVDQVLHTSNESNSSNFKVYKEVETLNNSNIVYQESNSTGNSNSDTNVKLNQDYYTLNNLNDNVYKDLNSLNNTKTEASDIVHQNPNSFNKSNSTNEEIYKDLNSLNTSNLINEKVSQDFKSINNNSTKGNVYQNLNSLNNSSTEADDIVYHNLNSSNSTIDKVYQNATPSNLTNVKNYQDLNNFNNKVYQDIYFLNNSTILTNVKIDQEFNRVNNYNDSNTETNETSKVA